jgi:excinuclease ABC subunit C
MSLIDKLQDLPKSAGVYQYFDKNNKLLYIGKAKNLRNRVKSYFRFTPSLSPANNLSMRVNKMVLEISDIDYLVVDTEHDALILENSLIKQLKPKYNILLRDDKTYPYIYVDMSCDFPRFEITRKIIKKPKIKYFGPFSGSVKYVLNAIYSSFDLIQRKNCLREKKACLFYQINRCLAPCEDKVSIKKYNEILQDAIKFLNDRKLMSNVIEQKMQEYAENLQFEEALEMKKTLLSIQKSTIKTPIDFASCENIDIFSIYAQNNKACILKTFIRDGKLTATTYNIIKDQLDIDIVDVYKRMIVDFYNLHSILVPDEILVAHKQDDDEIELLEEFLYKHFNKKIKIYTPKIGSKKHLINTTLTNAQMLLEKSLYKNEDEVLINIKSLFNLNNIPFRVESFDNSHMFAQAKVGAMIVYENEKFIKNSYRQYHLESNDEYSQMREMLTRRIDNKDKEALPDLWVIDGGKALLDLALFILESMGLEIDVVAIAKEKIDAKANRAKGKAKDIIYTKEKIFKLDTNIKELLFVQKLRDEAHRFAIKNHRLLKSKEDRQISLLKIKGIGEAKLKKLLNYFASFDNIKKATQEELEVVVSKKEAKDIYEYFNI